MPKLTRDEIQEREKFVIDLWKKLWKGLKPGQNIPAERVTEQIVARYHEKMRSDKLYHLRTRAIEEMRAAGHNVIDPPRKIRKPVGAPITQAARGAPARRVMQVGEQVSTLPQIIKGLSKLTPAQAVERVLRTLYQENLVNVAVEHSGEDYVVVNAIRS